MKVMLGTQIKVIRTIRQMKQGELAERADVRQPTLSDFENGKYLPCEETLQRIKAALRWPSDEDRVQAAFAVLASYGDGDEPRFA